MNENMIFSATLIFFFAFFRAAFIAAFGFITNFHYLHQTRGVMLDYPECFIIKLNLNKKI